MRSTIIRGASLTCKELPRNPTANTPLHRDVDIDVGEQRLNSFFIARSRYDLNLWYRKGEPVCFQKVHQLPPRLDLDRNRNVLYNFAPAAQKGANISPTNACLGRVGRYSSWSFCL